VTGEVLSGQIAYYRRRASEYDATAYGDIEAACGRITRLVAEMRVLVGYSVTGLDLGLRSVVVAM